MEFWNFSRKVLIAITVWRVWMDYHLKLSQVRQNGFPATYMHFNNFWKPTSELIFKANRRCKVWSVTFLSLTRVLPYVLKVVNEKLWENCYRQQKWSMTTQNTFIRLCVKKVIDNKKSSTRNSCQQHLVSWGRLDSPTIILTSQHHIKHKLSSLWHVTVLIKKF